MGKAIAETPATILCRWSFILRSFISLVNNLTILSETSKLLAALDEGIIEFGQERRYNPGLLGREA
jgi:hypothetical protein